MCMLVPSSTTSYAQLFLIKTLFLITPSDLFLRPTFQQICMPLIALSTDVEGCCDSLQHLIALTDKISIMLYLQLFWSVKSSDMIIPD